MTVILFYVFLIMFFVNLFFAIKIGLGAMKTQNMNIALNDMDKTGKIPGTKTASKIIPFVFGAWIGGSGFIICGIIWLVGKLTG